MPADRSPSRRTSPYSSASSRRSSVNSSPSSSATSSRRFIFVKDSKYIRSNNGGVYLEISSSPNKENEPLSPSPSPSSSPKKGKKTKKTRSPSSSSGLFRTVSSFEAEVSLSPFGTPSSSSNSLSEAYEQYITGLEELHAHDQARLERDHLVFQRAKELTELPLADTTAAYLELEGVAECPPSPMTEELKPNTVANASGI